MNGVGRVLFVALAASVALNAAILYSSAASSSSAFGGIMNWKSSRQHSIIKEDKGTRSAENRLYNATSVAAKRCRLDAQKVGIYGPSCRGDSKNEAAKMYSDNNSIVWNARCKAVDSDLHTGKPRFALPTIDLVTLVGEPSPSIKVFVARMRSVYGFARIIFVTNELENCEQLVSLDPCSLCIARDALQPPYMYYNDLAEIAPSLHLNRTDKVDYAGASRIGWYIQQFSKFLVLRIVKDLSDPYLVWDSDLFVIRPWLLLKENGQVNVCARRNIWGDTVRAFYQLTGFNASNSARVNVIGGGGSDGGQQHQLIADNIYFVCGYGFFHHRHVYGLLNRIDEQLRGASFPANLMEHAHRDGWERRYRYFSEYQSYALYVTRVEPSLLFFHWFFDIGMQETKQQRLKASIDAGTIVRLRNPPPIETNSNLGDSFCNFVTSEEEITNETYAVNLIMWEEEKFIARAYGR